MILHGDCIQQMKELEENSVEAIVTDPPYGLSFMGKKWDYDVPSIEVWKEAIRVLKPGGFLLSFAGTRTYHRMAVNIEDAGFEIRDMISWLYGSGFPKSLNIGKQIDKMNGRTDDYPELREYLKQKRADKKLTIKQVAERLGVYQALYGFYEQKNTCSQIPSKRLWNKLKEILDLDNRFDKLIARIEAEREIIGKKKWDTAVNGFLPDGRDKSERKTLDITAPNLPEAQEWEGWGTALKPACEPIVVARKPLSEKNVALNVLKHGTGGINIDVCRIGNEIRTYKAGLTNNDRLNDDKWNKIGDANVETSAQGRFPANIILDEEAGKMLDEQSGVSKSSDTKRNRNTLGSFGMPNDTTPEYSDKGGASRFFYCAKASKSERNLGCEDIEPKQQDESRKEGNPGGDNPRNRGVHERKNNHPTVKPIKLMEYLVKLVSCEGATVLDPFLGSGTTAIACVKLNREFIGIEKEEEYIKIAEARLKPYTEQNKLFALDEISEGDKDE